MKTNVSRRTFLAGAVAGTAASGCSVLKSSKGKNGMPMRPLGKTGLNVSILAFGAGSRYALVRDEAEAEKMIHRAIELGVNYFDNAYAYGEKQESQRRYGRWLCPNYRDQIFLTNKSLQRTRDEYLREFDESLANYKTDSIDAMYFHGVDTTEDVETITGKGGALEAVRSLVEQKAVSYIGMTGHRNPDAFIMALDRIELDLIMFPINAARAYDMEDRVIPYAQKKKVPVVAMKTTAQDALIKKGGKPADLIRYSMSQPVSAAVVGMRDMKVLESCVQIAKSFTPMPAPEQKSLMTQVASAATDGSLYYLKPDYVDGCQWA